jgi:hypothetical protein
VLAASALCSSPAYRVHSAHPFSIIVAKSSDRRRPALRFRAACGPFVVEREVRPHIRGKTARPHFSRSTNTTTANRIPPAISTVPPLLVALTIKRPVESNGPSVRKRAGRQ